jgi:hypothetical protein
MNRYLLLLIVLIAQTVAFGQSKYYGIVVTKQNDTLRNVEFKLEGSFEVHKLLSVQRKTTVLLNNELVEYYPKELKYFKFMLGGVIYIFDNVDDKFFAQRMYVGNVKLHKVLREVNVYPNRNIFRHYLIRRPNGVNSELVAMGLSRLITKKTMLPAIEDCKVSYDKIDNDIIKIKDEDKLIEFVKDYENNCFKS